MEPWLLFALSAYACAAISGSIDKYVVNQHYYPLAIALVNMLLDALILYLVGAFFLRFTFPAIAELPWLLLLGALLACSMIFYFEAFHYDDMTELLPYSKATSILLLFVLSILLFQEHVSGLNIMGIVLLLVGIFFVIAKGFSLPSWDTGLFLITLSMLFSVGYLLLSKHLLSSFSPSVLGFFLYASGSLVGFTYLLVRRSLWYKADRSIEFKGLAQIALSGIFGSGGMLLLFFALRLGEGSKIYPLQGVQTLFLLLIGFFILKEKLTWERAIGIVIAALGIALVTL